MVFKGKYIRFLLIPLGLMGVYFMLGAAPFPKIKPKGVKTIVIDAGHGGKDPGCNGSSAFEKDVALGIALKLGALIEKNLPDVKVIYTRKTDEFVELEERAQIANRNNADLFISIHCNAASVYATYKDKKGKVHYKTYKDKKGKIHKVEIHNPKPYGSATYVMGISNEKGKLNTAKRENAAMLLEDNYQKTYNGFDPESDEAYIIMSLWTGAFVEQSANLAAKIQDEYVKKAGRVDKGVQRQSIWVLWRTAMPSILTEVGFLTNPEEEKFLASEKGQNYMASALFRAVRRYKDEAEGMAKKYDDDLEKQEPLVNENLAKGNKNENGSDTDSSRVANPAQDELYNGFLKEADEKYKAKNYTEALALYEKCTEQKPEEKYPLARIDECKKKIAESKSQNQSEEPPKENNNKPAIDPKIAQSKYNAFIIQGDKFFDQKKWEASKKQYTQALSIFPDKVYPAERIEELDSLLKQESELAKQQETIPQKKDSIKSPHDIVNAYKDNTPKKDPEKKQPEEKAVIIFRVQFAMSQTEPDLNTTKFSSVENPWYYKAGDFYKITAGSFEKPDDAVNLQNKMRESGYKDCFVVAFKKNKRIDYKEAIKQINSHP